jgi:DNA polymerase-3 subunit delta'
VPAWRTRGHAAASATLARAVTSGAPPQSLLIIGPAGVGKTTLAMDLAAGLLCRAADPGDRPCGTCISCRKVEHGNHPDLHRLSPQGAGREIRIGTAGNPDPGTARALIHELALSPMEGAVRVAVVEDAGRMNEEAQNALLKTLEEPPPGTCLVLCAEDEDSLAPTVRSRCARLRIGRVRDADIEAVLVERGLADAGRAAAIARIAGGRPGRAIALATAPEAALTRERIVRELLDLADHGPAERLAAARGLVAAADEMEAALERALARETDTVARSDARAASATPPTSGPPRPDEPDAEPAAGAGAETGEGRVSPAARRRGVLSLASIWRELARDVAIAGLGGRAELRDVTLLEEVTDRAARIDRAGIERFLALLDRSTASVEQNANPELVLDVLLLSWPRGRPPTAAPA